MYTDQQQFQSELELRIYKDLNPINSISKEDMHYMTHSNYDGFHIKIIDNKLYIIKEKPSYELRNLRLLDLFVYIVNHFKIDNTEFVIHTGDHPPDTQLPIFVQSKKTDQVSGILYPDFSFYRWDWPAFPEASVDKWDDFRINIKNYYTKLNNKKPVCFFRGNNTNSIRETFYYNTKNNPLFDIDIGVDWNKRSSYIPLKEHTKYKYLINFPGRSSSGRFKYLLMMRSVVFDIKGEYDEFWYHILKNNYHYYQFNNSSDIIQLMEQKTLELEKDKDLYIENMYNLQEIEKYFSMNSIILYWLRLLSVYTSKLNYEVHL